MAAVDRARRASPSAPSRSSRRRRSGPEPGRGGRAPAPDRPATRSPRRGSRHRPRPRTCAARPWFRLDPVLDGEGALRGQRLAAGSAAAGPSRPRTCPPESFAADRSAGSSWSGPMTAPRRASRRSTSPSGCAWTSATSATSSAARRSIRPVRRSTRCASIEPAAPTSGSGGARSTAAPARRILDPLPADARFGRTFSTEFTWAADGRTARDPVLRRGRLSDADRRPGWRARRRRSRRPISASSSGSTAIAR